MTNETMSEKEEAFDDYIKVQYDERERSDIESMSAYIELDRRPFEYAWDACAKRAIDKEKLVEWLVGGWKTAEDHYDLATILKGKIENGEFDLK